MKIFYTLGGIFVIASICNADVVVNYSDSSSNPTDLSSKYKSSEKKSNLNTRYHNIAHNEQTKAASQKINDDNSKKTTLVTKANRYIAAITTPDAASAPAKNTPTATQDNAQTKRPNASHAQPGAAQTISAKDFKGVVLSNYSSVFMDNTNAYQAIYNAYGGNARYFLDGRPLLKLAEDIFIDADVIGSAYTPNKQTPASKDAAAAAASDKVAAESSGDTVASGDYENVVENNDLFLDSIIFFDQNKWSVKVNKNFIHSMQSDLGLGKNIKIIRVLKDRALFVLNLSGGQASVIVNTYGNTKIFPVSDNLHSNTNYSIILDSAKETLAIMLRANQKFSYNNMEVGFTREANDRPRYTNRFTAPTNANRTAENEDENDTEDNTSAPEGENNRATLQNLFQKSEILELYQQYSNSIAKQQPNNKQQAQ